MSSPSTPAGSFYGYSYNPQGSTQTRTRTASLGSATTIYNDEEFYDGYGAYQFGQSSSGTPRPNPVDPIDYKRGIDLDGFAGNNPVMGRDPSGLQADPTGDNSLKNDEGEPLSEPPGMGGWRRADRERELERELYLNRGNNPIIRPLNPISFYRFVEPVRLNAFNMADGKIDPSIVKSTI